MGSAETLEIYPLKIQRGLTQLSFLRIPTRPGATRPLFDLLERHNVPVRFLIEGCAGDYNRDFIVCIDSDAFNRTVDITVSRLRQKLKDDPQKPSFIKTVWGAGYVFIGKE